MACARGAATASGVILWSVWTISLNCTFFNKVLSINMIYVTRSWCRFRWFMSGYTRCRNSWFWQIFGTKETVFFKISFFFINKTINLNNTKSTIIHLYLIDIARRSIAEPLVLRPNNRADKGKLPEERRATVSTGGGCGSCVSTHNACKAVRPRLSR